MRQINEWETPAWAPHAWEEVPPPAGRPPRPLAPPAAASATTQQVERICASLRALGAKAPEAVHFFQGEGLRWIRAGFGTGEALAPARVRDVGSRIAAALAPDEQLYFHALRPHDMLFFLQDGNPAKSGMPPQAFGMPLPRLLQAWGLKPLPA
jgi:hypothetical protein